jgi:DMSO reductase anchor subunit
MLQGVGRSPLSRQAALVALFLVLTIVVWALALGDVAALWLDIVTVVVGFAAVLAAGLTYVLGSQPRWRHGSSVVGFVATILALGASLGLVVALGWRDELLGGSDGQIAGVVLALIGTGWLMGTVSAWKPRVVLLPLASVALVTAALSLLTPWLAIVSLIALLAALFAWRSTFFLAASANGWRREVRWARPQTEGGEV